MLLDLILLTILVVFVFLHLKNKAELAELKKQLFRPGNTTPAREKEPEEFTLGLKNLNSEFTGNVLLDPLTGLPGREAFEDRLQQALHQSHRFQKSFGVMLLDINEFRIINESQGYEIGDKLLQEVAKRLQSVIRQIDTVSRYAGNTFIFLLPQLSLPETAAYVAQRVLDNLVQPFEIEDKKLLITASIGVSIYPNDGNDMKTLIHLADDALHQAKVRGKSRYQFYHQELHALSQRELSLNAFLCRPDLLQKLLIYYQPHVHVGHNQVTSVQAIPHIDLPEYGLIAFNDFSKIAENCGKITDMGEWLIRNAITQFQKWHTEGFRPEHLIVNVTLRQIENPQFIYKISQMLQELQMNPKQLIFEISGDNLFSNAAAVEKSFTMIQHVGIQISVSIFALGHFALQKLTQLPINYLKIDSKLIRDKKIDEKNEIIMHMIITLANDMKIQVIAEGVDNEKQKAMLRELGCELMQGKLFGDLVPVDAVVKNLT